MTHTRDTNQEPFPIKRLDLSDEGTVEEIWRLQHASYPIEAELIGFDRIPPLMDTLRSLRECGEQFYGYFVEDELAGAISTESEQPGELTICRMMVHPRFFRRGIAGSLLDHVLNGNPDVKTFIVSTGLRNTPAVNLYEKKGFVQTSVQEAAPNVPLATFHKKA